jgi:hypothetical protein
MGMEALGRAIARPRPGHQAAVMQGLAHQVELALFVVSADALRVDKVVRAFRRAEPKQGVQSSEVFRKYRGIHHMRLRDLNGLCLSFLPSLMTVAALLAQAPALFAMDDVQAQAINLIRDTMNCAEPVVHGPRSYLMSTKAEYLGDEVSFKFREITSAATDTGWYEMTTLRVAQVSDLEVVGVDRDKQWVVALQCRGGRACLTTSKWFLQGDGYRAEVSSGAGKGYVFCDAATADRFIAAFNILAAHSEPRARADSSSSHASLQPQSRDGVDLSRSLNGYVIRDNRDANGTDVAPMIKNVELTDCASACKVNVQCQAFTYDKWNRACFLKANVVQLKLDPKSQAGIDNKLGPLPAGSEEAAKMIPIPGKYFPGVERSSSIQQTADACSSVCYVSNACVAYTFYTATNLCKLFNTTGVYSRDPQTESGVKTQNK